MKFVQICDRIETTAAETTRTALVGTWINSNLDTNSIARVEITDPDGKLQLQVFAMGPDGLIDWGTTDAQVFAGGPASRAGVGFTAGYDFGFAEARLQAMIMKGLLVLAQFHFFKDDSGRADYFLREYFALSHDRFKTYDTGSIQAKQPSESRAIRRRKKSGETVRPLGEHESRDARDSGMHDRA